MNYCTYSEYQAAGGAVSEQAFGVLCSRASRLIDSATFGNAEPHAAVCESCRQMLADACAQIVDLLAAQLAVGTAPGAASVSNDGYSRCGYWPDTQPTDRNSCCTAGSPLPPAHR